MIIIEHEEREEMMRIESSVTSISWIPSEAIRGLMKLPMDMGIGHYDAPLPDVIDDLESLRAKDAFRFANELRGWIEVKDGQIVGFGQAGKGHIGVTDIRLGPAGVSVAAVAFPEIRPEPQVGKSWVRFVQTAGGRTGVPMPRKVRRKPFVQITAPIAWTTLVLTINADGTWWHKLSGASQFPRHWVYDAEGKLVEKSATVDFKSWAQNAFGQRTPWGSHDSSAVVHAAESALERELSKEIMKKGAKPRHRKVRKGRTLVNQGEPGDEMFLLLDGVLAVEVDGRIVTEVGPGAVLGERAILESKKRTATLRAVTDSRVAIASGDQIDREALVELSRGRRREHEPKTPIMPR